jgi:hypothetical protein
MAKKLSEIINENDLYSKVKALYDRPGTPGEKAAAKAAMNRISASKTNKPKTSDDFDMENGHHDVLRYHDFKPVKVKPEYEKKGWEAHVHGNITVGLNKYNNSKVNYGNISSPKHKANGLMADTLFDEIVKAKHKNETA